MRWLLAGSLGTPNSVSEHLPSARLWREIRVQKPKPRPGTGAPDHQVSLCPSSNLPFVLHSPFPPFPFLLLRTPIQSKDKYLFLDQDLDSKAGQASFFPHFPANLCLNLDLTLSLVRKGQCRKKDQPSLHKRSKYGNTKEAKPAAPQ